MGKIADLTLFNPMTVRANASYKAGENGLQPTGIPYVIVNGTIVVKLGKVLPVRPGQPIRFPEEAKGRYEPVSITRWLGEFSIRRTPCRSTASAALRRVARPTCRSPSACEPCWTL